MQKIIEEKLREVERTEQVKILLAIESGSRAWGFASPDSDYDVRFIYVRPREHYLRLNKGRDVIEFMLNDVLDINGWDLDKTLRLLHSSNPTLFEWMQSPIVYHQHPFAQRLQSLAGAYFLQKPSLYHYLHMAEGNYREYLRGESVKVKKYFYVLRPLLACRHILRHQTPPPMLFDELLHSQMEAGLIPAVERLLETKVNTPEVTEGPRVESLNAYIEQSLPELRRQTEQLPAAPRRDWDALNELFWQGLALD